MRPFARLRAAFFWWAGRPFAALLCRLLWPRATAGVVVVHEDRLLAVDTGSYLMLPLGGLAYGESFADAARREAREEAGAAVELGRRLREAHNAYGGVEVLFAGSLRDGDSALHSTVSGTPTWVPVDAIDDHQWRFDRDVAHLVAEHDAA
jgi:8-oxo-dGTP pyrophosphatase MutT (NUDIX family)